VYSSTLPSTSVLDGVRSQRHAPAALHPGKTRSTLPSTSALDGLRGQRHAPTASTPGKDPVPIVQEAGWTPGPVWTGGKSRPHRDSIPGPSSP